MNFETLAREIIDDKFVKAYGSVHRVARDSLKIVLPFAQVGALCQIETEKGMVPVEIVSLDPKGHVAMPLDSLEGIRLGNRIVLTEQHASLAVSEKLLGRVIDSTGVDYQTGESITGGHRASLYGLAQNPMDRELITDSLDLGIRSINSCLTCGKGQRLGIFAGSGVGKSVLLGMMARFTSADVVVIALIGERGREVKEFLEFELGEGRSKSVVVVETAEKSAVRRVRGAYAATAVAEYFRSRGKNVLLLMDSLTRFAMAQREIGIAAGEPPTTKGYPPSTYSALSRLVERAGNWGKAGSITGLYSVLVEGDDLDDPVADSARAILDGHIVLSRRLANRGQYPAVDVLQSVSRVMDHVVDKKQKALARKLKATLARYSENEDAIQYGMYTRGSDLDIDECIELEPMIREFLIQDRDEKSSFYETNKKLEKILG